MYVALVTVRDIYDDWERTSVVGISEDVEALKRACQVNHEGTNLIWEGTFGVGKYSIKNSGQTQTIEEVFTIEKTKVFK